MDPPELKTLLNCREQLTVVVRNNLEDIASFLKRNDIISYEKYREVTDIKSNKTDEEKAKIVLGQLSDKVQEDTSFYSIFTAYLRSKKQYSKITERLNEEYSKITDQSNEEDICVKRKSKWLYLEFA